MNIIRKYKLTEEEKKALDTVGDILIYIRDEAYGHFNSILGYCELDSFYYDYENICEELKGED